MNTKQAQTPLAQETKEERHTAKGFTAGLVLICAAALISLIVYQGRPAWFSRGFTVDADATDGAKAEGASPYWSEEGKMNINEAPADALEMLPGIGPVLAQRIIEGRPYGNIEELTRVSGIGDATLEKLKDLIYTD
ncbi:MAG TPA: ComEA family DNA-binding protein [Candidatus Acidoferrum sp.]|nr:ComEA family DNA-binding protein [Candidatus Acidoferrum sp.]